MKHRLFFLERPEIPERIVHIRSVRQKNRARKNRLQKLLRRSAPGKISQSHTRLCSGKARECDNVARFRLRKKFEFRS